MLPHVSIRRLVSWLTLVAVLFGSMVMTFALAPTPIVPSPYDDLCIVPPPPERETVSAAAGQDASAHPGHVGGVHHPGHGSDPQVVHCPSCLFRAGHLGPVVHEHVLPALPLRDVGVPATAFVASVEPAAWLIIQPRAPPRLD